MRAAEWIAIAVTGGVGSVARFRLDGLVQSRNQGTFPLGTLAVNLVGSFALGLLTGLGTSGAAMLVLGVGFLGSFTTFSTWMFETHRLAEDRRVRSAVWNVAIPVLGGLAAAALGWAVGTVG